MMELLRILGLLINHLFDTLTAIDGPLQPKFTNVYEVVSTIAQGFKRYKLFTSFNSFR